MRYAIVLGRDPEGKMPFGRPRHKWKANIKIYLKYVDFEMYFIIITQAGFYEHCDETCIYGHQIIPRLAEQLTAFKEGVSAWTLFVRKLLYSFRFLCHSFLKVEPLKCYTVFLLVLHV